MKITVTAKSVEIYLSVYTYVGTQKFKLSYTTQNIYLGPKVVQLKCINH